MNAWLVWLALVLTVLVLGLLGYYFSLGTVRVTAALVALSAVVYITWYGVTHPAKPPPGNLSDAFIRGADAFSTALFQWLPLPQGRSLPGPGQIGWIAIAVLFVIGYRELEAWTLHHQARSLDTSALTGSRQNDSSGDAKDDLTDSLTDRQRHDRLAAELKFRLPAVELRSPAILPGGSRSSELASIAEASGVSGSGLAGAVIRFFGMLWPSPRRVRVRVWVEWASHTKMNDVTKVTVGLDDPRTGASIATKTLAAGSLDEAASVVAGYVAQHIFAEDPTAPPWCTAAADGGDLAALLLARQVRVHPESEQRVGDARSTKIGLLEGVAYNNLCAGVARYELAHLCDLTGRHAKALLLHAKNREQYPRFYRGRYRLAMSLEMIANPDPGTRMKAKQAPKLDETVKILQQCDPKRTCTSEAFSIEDGKVKLSPELRCYLLEAAWDELQKIRKNLTLSHVIWKSLWHRDERAILKPYWQLRYRQAFHDGACVAQLLVAVRRTLPDRDEHRSAPTGPEGRAWPPAPRPPHARTIMRIATAIAVDSSDIAKLLGIRPVKPLGNGKRSVVKRQRTRRRPRQCSTRSWQAAYNLACVYAAIAQDRRRQLEDAQTEDEARRIKGELTDLIKKVIKSLEFAMNIPECEMDRPWEWIAHDPDFGFLRSRGDQCSREFRHFLKVQKRRDYPFMPTAQPGAARGRHPRQDQPPSTQDAGTAPAGVLPGGSGSGPWLPLPDGRRLDEAIVDR